MTKKRKILIVDDSLFMRKVLSDILSDNYDLIEAENAGEALAQYREGQPDMILLDIIFPGEILAGISILEKVREDNEDIPVIMISSIGQEDIVEECREKGATDYLIKPFESTVVMRKITKYLS
ncbi:response regulator [Fangia hongkongensis]|uniref:response regulator n=1 Tax=Fangia hongkongensis TaxID=270495 RepID=UPI0003717AD1|nr:response regulator [Fangia hongkongensis]MBK2124068.1 response regulator [Fangia hongkongensis]